MRWPSIAPLREPSDRAQTSGCRDWQRSSCASAFNIDPFRRPVVTLVRGVFLKKPQIFVFCVEGSTFDADCGSNGAPIHSSRYTQPFQIARNWKNACRHHTHCETLMTRTVGLNMSSPYPSLQRGAA
jgi:hypothetical protein